MRAWSGKPKTRRLISFKNETNTFNFVNQADIIVFSEDGLTGFEFLSSEYFLPFAQFLPDNAIGWNACKNKGLNKSCNEIGNVCVPFIFTTCQLYY